MRTRTVVAIVTMTIVICAGIRLAGAQSPEHVVTPNYQPFPTIWTGVYATDQAERGKATATKLCGSCHGQELKGTDTAPGLTGPQFLTAGANCDCLTSSRTFRAPCRARTLSMSARNQRETLWPTSSNRAVCRRASSQSRRMSLS